MERFVGAISLTAMLWCLASIAQEPLVSSEPNALRSNWLSQAIESWQIPQFASSSRLTADHSSLSQTASNLAIQTFPNQNSASRSTAKKSRSIAKEVVLSRATLANILVHKFQLKQKFQQDSQRQPILKQVSPQSVTSQNVTLKNVTLKDVTQTHWAYADIQTVLRLGIMSVHRQGQFLPNQRVTRAEAFSSIAQATGRVQFSDRMVEQVLDRYPDAATIPAWARRSMAAALHEGFVNLRQGDRIDPLGAMTTVDLAHALTVYHQQQNYLSWLDITQLGVGD